jgi:type VI secretion system secreted protein VgrG
MSDGFTQDNLSLTVSTPLAQDTLLLTSLHGEERLSGLFHFTLELRSEESRLDFNRIVGQRATVTLALANGTKRYFNGIVGRFTQGGRDVRFTTYYAELFPWLWLLTMTRDCRIFQHQSVPEIIEAVFQELGCTDYRLALASTYIPREYCVQYQESAFDFVSRLMEDEGIFYFFEHAADTHTLVLADDADAHANCPGLASVRWAHGFPSRHSEDVITHCTLAQQVIPTAYAMDDFHFETPNTNLLVTATGTDGNRRLYDYPGGFTKQDAGEKKANLRLEACEWPQRLFQGDSVCPTFTAGHTFTFSGHTRNDVNEPYVLRWVSHAATAEGYTNAFEAFPATVPFRSPQVTKKPVIVGSQTAIVVGKSGEEIWTDKYGRVKVQFPWDQRGTHDENSSCWIRVAQGWAGKNWGTHDLESSWRGERNRRKYAHETPAPGRPLCYRSRACQRRLPKAWQTFVRSSVAKRVLTMSVGM